MKRKILQYMANIGMEILEDSLGHPEFDFFYKRLATFNAYCQVFLEIDLN